MTDNEKRQMEVMRRISLMSLGKFLAEQGFLLKANTYFSQKYKFFHRYFSKQQSFLTVANVDILPLQYNSH